MVENPGMETHIHPFQIFSAREDTLNRNYLHTSPEFCMKQLLANKEEDFNKIFTVGYCFRDEPKSPIHRKQFLMLEWYRKNEHYFKIMDDCENLIKSLDHKFNSKPLIQNFERVTINEIFKEFLNFEILDFLNLDELIEKIRKDFPDVVLPATKCAWDDYYFLLFLNHIEPQLVNYPYLLLYEFPAPLAALSTLKPEDERVCERFEIYLSGIELCNCFNELTDYQELKLRFESQAQEKKELYGYELPWPEQFMNMMKSGYPKSSGIALGVERLLKVIGKVEKPFYF